MPCSVFFFHQFCLKIESVSKSGTVTWIVFAILFVLIIVEIHRFKEIHRFNGLEVIKRFHAQLSLA